MKSKGEYSVTKKGDIILTNPSELRDKAITIIAKKLAEKKRKDLGLDDAGPNDPAKGGN